MRRYSFIQEGWFGSKKSNVDPKRIANISDTIRLLTNIKKQFIRLGSITEEVYDIPDKEYIHYLENDSHNKEWGLYKYYKRSEESCKGLNLNNLYKYHSIVAFQYLIPVTRAICRLAPKWFDLVIHDILKEKNSTPLLILPKKDGETVSDTQKCINSFFYVGEHSDHGMFGIVMAVHDHVGSYVHYLIHVKQDTESLKKAEKYQNILNVLFDDILEAIHTDMDKLDKVYHVIDWNIFDDE